VRRNSPRLCLAVLAGLVSASWISMGAHAAVIGPTPIALSGTAAPVGGSYISFGARPVLNGSGQVAFIANLTGGSSASGLFAGTSNSMQAAALQGTAAPAGGNYESFNNIVLNDSRQVAYHATLTGGSSTTGIFVGAPGSVQAAALQGTSAPAGGNYSSIAANVTPALNASGQVGFVASLTGGSSSSGLFAGAAGSVLAVALQGTSAPSGGNYTGMLFPALNDSGKMVIAANLSGATFPTGLFAGTPGSVQTIAVEGMATPAGGTYYFLYIPATINNAGQVAYIANISGGSSTQGLFTGAPGSVQTVALRDTAAPAGRNYNTLGVPLLNSSGQVAFRATLTDGSSSNGIFAGSVGSLQTIALGGSATPDGVGNFNVLGSNVAFNAPGQVAFLSSLIGTGVTDANDNGLYAGTAGNVFKIVREGDILDVDPGLGIDLRTVSSIAFTTGSGGQDGKTMSLNDDGLLVYRLTFTDSSSGIFTSQIAAVPEPGTLGLLAAGGIVCWLSYRRRRAR
jgi:hypothetical protein